LTNEVSRGRKNQPISIDPSLTTQLAGCHVLPDAGLVHPRDETLGCSSDVE
jgi:hypothetical protein